MSEERVAVEVKSEAERKLVVETPEGREQTYYLDPPRTMYLHVQKLQVCKEVRPYHFGSDEFGSPPELALYVRGTATLEDRSISVIGEPGNKTRTLSIGFHALDEDVSRQRQEWAQKEGKTPRHTSATVGFIRHTWTAGNDGEWFVECAVSADTLSAISCAVSYGTLRAMTVGLKLQGIYSNADWADNDWAPPSMKTDWFMRPNRRGNNIDSPEMAHGDITCLSLDQAPVNLRPSPEADPESEAFYESISATMAA